MMADIPALPSTKPIGTTASPPYGSGENTVVPTEIQSLPDKFSLLARPVQVTGTIVSLNYNDTFLFRTTSGDLLLKLPTPEGGGKSPLTAALTPLVQNQKPLNLAIQPGAPPAQALLTLPPATPSPTVAAPFQAALAAGPRLVPGTTFTAVVLPQDIAKNLAPTALQSSPTSQAMPQQNALVEALAGSSEAGSGISAGGFMTTPSKWAQLTEFIKAATSGPTPSPAENIPLALPAGPAKETMTQPLISAETKAAIPFPLKTGTEWLLRLNDVLPPGVFVPTADAPEQIVATVVGKGPDGQLLLSAGENTLYIREPGNVAIGSKLTFTVLPPKDAPDFSLSPAKEYDAPALQNVMAALAQIEPALAAQMAQTRIPRPALNLPSALIFLFSALQQGSVKSWLGDEAAERLERAGKSGLIARLAEEFQQASGPARDPATGQWRAFPLPLCDGNQYQLLRLYVRRDRDRKQDSGGYPVSPQTRFLITMNMSRLGPMQMDGLSQKRQLDLIIRSDRPLPQTLPNELRGFYLTTLDALGLAGTMSFQTGKQGWIAVQKAAESAGIMT